MSFSNFIFLYLLLSFSFFLSFPLFFLTSFFIVIGSQIALVPKTSRDSSASISIYHVKNKLIN